MLNVLCYKFYLGFCFDLMIYICMNSMMNMIHNDCRLVEKFEKMQQMGSRHTWLMISELAKLSFSL